MFSRMRGVCGWWGVDGEVVEILEGVGVRRAKVIAAGELVEIEALGSGEIHLGDRVDLVGSGRVGSGEPRKPFDSSELLDDDDHDPLPEW
jgi:hypothetical protein